MLSLIALPGPKRLGKTRCKAGVAGLLLACIATSGPSVAAEPEKLPLFVGGGKVDVTPKGDYLKKGRAPIKVVRDPLFVRATFLKHGNDCAILVSIDKAIVSTDSVERARARLTQCPHDSIYISATHTHSAGDLAVLPTRERGYQDPEAARLEDAIVRAATDAAKGAKKARMGFTTTTVDLNVNRDLFDGKTWSQSPNPEGPTDKTLSLLYFVGDDGLPISVLMNYGMHPIEFFITGVLSADFPGEASRYVERRYPGSVSMFVQGASGDQNTAWWDRSQVRLIRTNERIAFDDRIGLRSHPQPVEPLNAPAKTDWDVRYRESVEQSGEIVSAMGAILGEAAITAMWRSPQPLDPSPAIRSGSTRLTCPGRERVNPSSPGARVEYRDAAPVEIKLSLLRLGDVALVGVDSEVYVDIVKHLKDRSPLSRTVVFGLTNGWGNYGYIYSNRAGDSEVFQVVGSRLKPGCAEDKIIDGALRLIHQTSSANDKPFP